MDDVLNIMKALADRNRMRIVAALQTHQELCACQVTELLQVKGATASRHLSQLVQAGLLKSRKEGRWIYFRLNKDCAKPVLKWLQSSLQETSDIQKDQAALTVILAREPEAICREQRGETCCPGKQMR